MEGLLRAIGAYTIHDNGVLFYLFPDHLGGTPITANGTQWDRNGQAFVVRSLPEGQALG